MDYLGSIEIIQTFTNQICRNRNYDYFDTQLDEIVAKQNNLTKINFIIKAQSTIVNTYLIETTSRVRQTCIIYLHGLSSYSLEGKYIIPYVNKEISLCLFDFGGHGRTEAQIVTYGIRQSQTIEAVLQDLKKKGFKKFVLWGRSMGAVAGLLYLKKHKYEMFNIKLIVLDSPFRSFFDVVKQIANKKTNLPNFLIQIALEIIRNNILKKHKIDLFEVDVQNCQDINVSAIFMYSKHDQLINWKHSQSIYKDYGGIKRKIEIKENHNQMRSEANLLKIFEIIKTETKTSCKKGIKIYSNDKENQNILRKYKSLKGFSTITTQNNQILSRRNTNILDM